MYFILSSHSHVLVDKTFATLPPSLLFSCDRVIIAYKISELDAFLLYFNKSTNPRKYVNKQPVMAMPQLKNPCHRGQFILVW